MATNYFRYTKKPPVKAFCLAFCGLALAFVAPKGARAEGSPPQLTDAVESKARGLRLNKSPIKELAGKVLIDAQLEVTQPVQIDKYANFVNVSTPSLTPSSGHSLLFANSAANQFIAKFSDGSTTILGSGGSSSGDITDVLAGLGLTGGGTSGSVTLYLSTPITSSYIPDYISASSVTATYLQQSSATATYLQKSSATATYLNIAQGLTQSSATATYLQLNNLVQGTGITVTGTTVKTITATGVTYQASTQCISATDFTTTSNAFQITNLSCTITPSSSGSRVRIIVSAIGYNNNVAATNNNYTIYRNTTDLGAASSQGFGRISGSATDTTEFAQISLIYIDAPATTSATTYSLRIRSSDNASAVGVGKTSSQIMVLDEVP